MLHKNITMPSAISLYYLLGLLLIAGCSGCSVDQQNPKPKPKPEKPLQLLWTFSYTAKTSGLSIDKSSPVLSDGKVLVNPDRRVTALDQQTGKMLWQVHNPDSTTIDNFKQLYNKQTFYIKGFKGITLTGVNINDGSIRWKYTLKKGKFTTLGSDAMSLKNLYVAGYDYHLYKFSKSGSLIYHKKIAHSAHFIRYYDNKLYIFQGFKNHGDKNPQGGIICLKPASIDTLWTYHTHNGGFYYATPKITNGIIYAGTTGPGEVVALNAKTGKPKWKKSGIISERLKMAGDTLFNSSGAVVVALDAKTGQQLWSHDFGSSGGSNLAYLNGYLYHAHGHGLYIFNAQTGKIVAGPINAPDGDDFYNANAGNGRIFIETDYHLYAYKAYSGGK